MNVTIGKSDFHGKVNMTSSKSHLHRALICAALGDKVCKLFYNGASEDVEATVACLRALGAEIADKGGHFVIEPIKSVKNSVLDCNESGSTLRFLLPVACALGSESVFTGSERLFERPLTPLMDELGKHGVSLEKDGNRIKVRGRLTPGRYTIRGDVSSQFITGLLLALPLLDGDSELEITGKIESKPYIDMTLSVLESFGTVNKIENNIIYIKSGKYISPECIKAEGDWSNGAFWCVLGALSGKITVHGLSTESVQGDRRITDILKSAGARVEMAENSVTVERVKLKAFTLDCSDTPDLVPVISVLASVCEGETKLCNIARLRLKESDRVETTMATIRALGGKIRCENDTLYITGVPQLEGGTVESANDHRIAMAAAVASCVCKNSVTVMGANAVNKSFKSFWNELEALGGNVKKWEE